jgi:hypothetical protein
VTISSAELEIGGELRFVEAEVVRQHPENIGGVFRPARQAEVDLGHPAMTVKTQEVSKARLKPGRKISALVFPRQPLRRGFAHRSRGGGIGAHLLCERPERQVHLRRGVVRKPAQHNLPLGVGSEAAQEHARESVGQQAGGEDRQ